MKFYYVEFHETPKEGYSQGSVGRRQTVTKTDRQTLQTDRHCRQIDRQTDRRGDGRGLHLKRFLLLHKERLVTTTSHGKPCITELV